jgi:type IV secretory pathway VirB10-like protein
MKKCVLIITVMIFSIYMFGCGKKQAAEEQQEPMSLEVLSALNTTAQPPAIPEQPVRALESKPQKAQTQPVAAAKLEPLPPAGPFKSTALEIQTALKNANFYTGAIDGKIGSMTRKAIEAFQKANNLQADGKVGPKTWAVMSQYLKPPAATTPAKTKKKR